MCYLSKKNSSYILPKNVPAYGAAVVSDLSCAILFLSNTKRSDKQCTLFIMKKPSKTQQYFNHKQRRQLSILQQEKQVNEPFNCLRVREREENS